MVEIIKKRTTELSDEQIEGIYTLFEYVFGKCRTVKDFKDQFLNTTLGYSFHALALDGDMVVGHNVYIPFRYHQKGEPFLLCLSVDAMTHPCYRGQGIYQKLLAACEEMAVKEGCKLRVGFPNDNSYPIQIKKFNYNDVGRLNTYCIPIRVGDFNSKLRLLNPIAGLLSRILIGLSKFTDDDREYTTEYHKDIKDFDTFRYRWFGGKYERIERDGATVIFKDSDFKGHMATFVLDVYPLSKRNFDVLMREVYKLKKDKSPFILYVGNLPFNPNSMIKIPKALEPKHFHFVTKILEPNFILSDSLDINNWTLNLSSYDLL